MLVEYIERTQIDNHKVSDTKKSFNAISAFENGGLTYFKVDNFNYKVIETDFILSITK